MKNVDEMDMAGLYSVKSTYFEYGCNYKDDMEMAGFHSVRQI